MKTNKDIFKKNIFTIVIFYFCCGIAIFTFSKILHADESVLKKYLNSYKQKSIFDSKQDIKIKQTSEKLTKKIIAYSNYIKKKERLKFSNAQTKRLFELFVSYNFIAEDLYNYISLKLDCEKTHLALYNFIKHSGWYRKFFIPITSEEIFDYEENITVRILVATHTGAHYFSLPYPMLLCLIFQESRFDSIAESYTGAIGLGQLTTIAIKEFNDLREIPIEEKHLQDAANEIKSTYKNPIFINTIKALGFKPTLPELGKFPKKIQLNQPLRKEILFEVGKELVKNGYSYGHNKKLLKRLVAQELHGRFVSGKYAAVHPTILKIMQNKYGDSFGNAYNIETNILISCLLLKLYYYYPWTINGKRIFFNSCVRSLMAIAAYNQGPSPVINFFNLLAKNNPKLSFQDMTIKDLKPFFTKNRILKAMQNNKRRTNELFEHVKNISSCANTVKLIDKK